MYKGNKIGLALSGGGYRGAAHIGALKALEELEFKPDIISGTSAGAVVAAMYSAGYHWQDIYKFFEEIELLSFKNYSFMKAGLIDSSKFIPLFSKVFPDNSFNALNITTFITTTDLLEAKTKYFHEGELIRPLIASCSIPGIFSPILLDDVLLCDGGVTNNLPTDPLLPTTDIIIGINLSPLQNSTLADLKSTRSIMERSFSIIRKKQSERNFKDCDVLISPDNLSNFNILSKSKLNEIFETGYQETYNKISELITKLLAA